MPRVPLTFFLGVFMMALVATTAASPTAASETQTKLLVVVTSENAEVQGMAMVLSRQSLAQGAGVRILLCGPAGDMALKGSPQVALKPRGMTPQGMLSGLVADGVTAEVCALYLPNREKQPNDLIDGVGVAKPPAIAETMLAPNTRLFTF